MGLANMNWGTLQMGPDSCLVRVIKQWKSVQRKGWKTDPEGAAVKEARWSLWFHFLYYVKRRGKANRAKEKRSKATMLKRRAGESLGSVEICSKIHIGFHKRISSQEPFITSATYIRTTRKNKDEFCVEISHGSGSHCEMVNHLLCSSNFFHIKSFQLFILLI